ncbi:LysR substrate-binding domain-containing protein, partial [Klebsiella michiganensis]|uniref:LysR substrate-binding domain-containing protein n=1 Tax=Klebsiella michiganensis TaxID=1134687 RepID=UPI002114B8C3
MAREHPLASRDAVNFQDLKEERIALLSVTPVDRLLSELLSQHGLDKNIRWRSPNLESIRNLVGRGLCVSLLVSPNI